MKQPVTTSRSKQRKFCLAYCGEAKGNGFEAAKIAGYKGSDATLRAIASQNLTKLNIIGFITELRADAERTAKGNILSAMEVLVGLSAQAKASLTDVLTEAGEFDLADAKKRGTDRLLKKMKVRKLKDGTVEHEYEIHDSQAAYVQMGRYYKLWVDCLETSEAMGLVVKIIADTFKILQTHVQDVEVLTNVVEDLVQALRSHIPDQGVMVKICNDVDRAMGVPVEDRTTADHPAN